MLPLPLGDIDEQFNLGARLTILPEDRRRHIAIFGQSGAGKTTLMRNMIDWDIHDGQGVAVIDPHGDLIEEIADAIPRHRTNDVIYFDPLDPSHAIGINLFEKVPKEQQPLVVSSFVSILKSIWGDSWGPRMENILRNGAYVLIEQQQPVSLVAFPRLLTDDNFRASSLRHVTNPEVLRFFTMEFDQWTATQRQEATSPVLNKLSAFLTNPHLRAILGQPRSSFDFRQMIDTGKILLCKFGKGTIGETESILLASLVATKTSLAALSRQDIPEAKRRLFLLYIDEAHNVTGAHLPTILSETRKYGLILTIATQTIEQFPPETRAAVFADCATLISFRVGGDDAAALQREFGIWTTAAHLQDLPNYKIFVRTMLSEQGRPARPSGHFVQTYSPFARTKQNTFRHRVIAASRENFARPREKVEEAVRKQFVVSGGSDAKAANSRRQGPIT